MTTKLRANPDIPFNRPANTGDELHNVQQVVSSQKIGPGGNYVRECQSWIKQTFNVPLALPTGSCTAALEIAVMLLDLQPGDEVILPSFGYPSTANAVVRAGATPVFVDVEPSTMNICPVAIADAVTNETRAIIVIHYAGIPCDMTKIKSLAEQNGLAVIEDAAQGFLAKYKDQLCGTIGTFGCFSFHETKSVHCGQGGALLVNDPKFAARAEIVLEKGTNRQQFLRKEVDKYTWQDIGSSYAIDNIRAAFLHAQLKNSQLLTQERMGIWQRYYTAFANLADQGRIEIAGVPDDVEINGHIFWIKVADEEMRARLIDDLALAGIQAAFHFVPLHSAPAGKRFGRFSGVDAHTTHGASRLLRLPIFHGFRDVQRVADSVCAFLDQH